MSNTAVSPSAASVDSYQKHSYGRRAGHALPRFQAGGALGRVKKKVAPLSGADSAHTWPP